MKKTAQISRYPRQFPPSGFFAFLSSITPVARASSRKKRKSPLISASTAAIDRQMHKADTAHRKIAR